MPRGLCPGPLTSFVGRTEELDQLRTAVSSRRLVTITGQAGVGKSRTAGQLEQALRRSLGGSTVLIPLASTDLQELLSELAKALGANAATTAEVVRALGDRPQLIVLDDLDDASGASPIIEEILGRTSETRVVVTSRGRTGIGGELPFALAPLKIPSESAFQRNREVALDTPACAMLLQRILDLEPAFDAAGVPAEDLVAVCRATDGVPRFIEAAARAISILGMRETAIAVGVDPAVLDTFVVSQARDVTAVAALDAALARVSPAAVDLARRLSLLKSGVDLRFAADLFAGGNLARLARPATELVDHSIVRSESAHGERRLRVPLHYRPHLKAQLERTERAQQRQMLRAALLERMRQCGDDWFSERQLARIQFLNRHAADITPLLGTMSTSERDAHEALDVISSLRYYWQLHPVDPWPRARDWIASALAIVPPQDASAVTAMLTDAYIAFHEGDLHGAWARLAAVDVGLTQHFEEKEFAAFVAALLALADGDATRAESELSSVLQRLLDTNEREHLGEKYWYLAAAQVVGGDQSAALETLADGLAYCDRVSDAWGRAYMWCLLALIIDRQGRHADAVRHVRTAVEVMSRFADRVGLALCVNLLAAFSARHEKGAKVAQLALLASGAAQSRPPVPLPELANAGAPDGMTRALPDDTSLAEVLGRIIDGDSPRVEPPRISVPSVLSARELEVAELIAEGLGNPAIAARLVLSRRTVEGHVQRILAKLDFRSRSQVAVWAAQQRGTSGAV